MALKDKHLKAKQNKTTKTSTYVPVAEGLFLNLTAQGIIWRFKTYRCLGPTSRDSDLIGLAWGLGMEVFLKLSIVSDM